MNTPHFHRSLIVQLVAIFALVMMNHAHGQSLSAAPVSGVAPLSVTVTWNVPNGTSCQAGGGWSGAKAAAGNEAVTLNAAASLSLACTVPGPVGPGQVNLTWTAATQNADGTPYTNAKGYQLYQGAADPATTALAPINNPATLALNVPNLAPGSTQCFAIASVSTTATGPAGPTACATIAGTPTTQPWTAAVPIAVTQPPTKPKAPTLTLTQP